MPVTSGWFSVRLPPRRRESSQDGSSTAWRKSSSPAKSRLRPTEEQPWRPSLLGWRPSLLVSLKCYSPLNNRWKVRSNLSLRKRLWRPNRETARESEGSPNGHDLVSWSRSSGSKKQLTESFFHPRDARNCEALRGGSGSFSLFFGNASWWFGGAFWQLNSLKIPVSTVSTSVLNKDLRSDASSTSVMQWDTYPIYPVPHASGFKAIDCETQQEDESFDTSLSIM